MRESEVEAQASVYVIMSKSQSSVKGSVSELKSLDQSESRQVCNTFVISAQVIYMQYFMVECMFIWPHNISRFTCVNVFHDYG